MFVISVELLAGWYVATAFNNRTRAEWPPHPARLFSALVAAWGEGEVSSERGQRERAALQWVERLPAPIVLADEVTGELDSANAELLLDLLAEVHRDEGMTLVLATHDPAVSARANRVVELRDGRVVGDRRLR